MLLSVIIPTCHRNDLLALCLDRLAPGTQTLAIDNYEVIVTDDGTNSTAEEMIRSRYPWATWAAGPGKGPASNRNHGATLAGGEWLVFTDDDCIPEAEFLDSYWQAASEGDVLVLEGMTSSYGVRERVDVECPINESGGCLWSCNMAIRKDLFFKLNGFDTAFPGAAMEDVDFRTRVIKSGESIKFVPKALVRHPWRERKGLSFWKLYSKSKRYFIKKHPEMIGSVSYAELGSDLARRLLKQLPPIAVTCKGRGLAREVALTFYTTYALIVYCKRGI